jgi:glycine/D-amino acid oxidase-like deaminating enzyme
MKRVDCVIIGQGLAGTTLAWQLHRRGFRVLVIDREGRGSASRIAAGLITPVTGKRLAKSWRWDELYPAATAFYRNLEAETGEALLHQRPALRLFIDEAERDEFHRRSEAVLAGLVRRTEINYEHLDAPFGGFEMPVAARLDVPHYLDVSRERFRRSGAYLTGEIELPADVELLAAGVRIQKLEVEARCLVFCHGFAPDSDPWFGGIRFNAAKGEILTLRIPGLHGDRVIHRGVWLAPAIDVGAALCGGPPIFRCGATYTWDDLNHTPTPEGRAEIESRLRTFLRLPFEVFDHQAAVRPVIDAGYPVLGTHPEFPQLAYFNGLGSKGSLLAPFFADQLAACLIGEREVESMVDVRRFLPGERPGLSRPS